MFAPHQPQEQVEAAPHIPFKTPKSHSKSRDRKANVSLLSNNNLRKSLKKKTPAERLRSSSKDKKKRAKDRR